jgi:RNA polymerase sigma-70 factor (ECF subfamily)
MADEASEGLLVDETATFGTRRDFPTTRWSVVLAARSSESVRRAALGTLFEAYWKPLYFYLRRKGAPVEAAKDTVQGFVAHLLEGDFASRLDPAKGSLRAYLRMALDNYARNAHEAEKALKRGGGATKLPIDVGELELELEGADGEPGRAYDRAWALAVLDRALARLERELEAGPRKDAFALVKPFFHPSSEPPSYADAAREAGLTVPALKSLLHRTRLRFRSLVREEVGETVASADERESEIARLLEALG